ncbi:GNAT family N-acetyltransferase [Thermoleophilum album]|uniref:GNAT family N-acetyltransferase n=1 Tax=Thermoleophilum album TaxID=29539 RepID=UPI00237CDF2E|nr:GNAT family N-acetyltransferase [Thermoleophilum album]WDT93335.1 GNAT family N-acetyltransferase [Thermoleophilum album]
MGSEREHTGRGFARAPSGVTVATLDRGALRARTRELVDVYLDAYRGLERYAYSGRRRVALYVRWLWRGDPGGFLVAFAGDRAVGFAGCHRSWESGEHGIEAELHELVVVRDLHGQGVGSLLLRAVVASARARGARALGLAVASGNARAQRFYERHGFRAEGTRGDWLRMRLGLGDERS